MHYVFSFLIVHENRFNRIRVHPYDPCNLCSMSFAPVYTFSEPRPINTSGHEIWDTTEKRINEIDKSLCSELKNLHTQ